MKSTIFVALCRFVLLIVVVKIGSCHGDQLMKNKNRLMTWMCLEFCEETREDIDFNLKQLAIHNDIVAAVSFEKYTLGANSTLVDNNLTSVSSDILKLGIEPWPLLSSFPHPPEFIDWMRTVFSNPVPFFESCVAEAKVYGYVGYNLDWEPTDSVTAQDGLDFATFIDEFAQYLHKQQPPLMLSVDVATWSPIWNYAAINATSADIVVSMGTYTSSDTSFVKQIDALTSVFGSRSAVGLESVNASTSARIPIDEVRWRFEEISNSSVTEVDIWCMPVPELWWPILEKFVYML